MFKAVCRYGGIGLTTLGAGALLIAGYGSLPAESLPAPVQRDVQPTANFSFARLFPFAVAPTPSTSSVGVGSVSTVVDDVSATVRGTLRSLNQFGPASLALDSVRYGDAHLPPAGSTAGTANITSMDQWVAGITGLASSRGALGFTENGVSYDPYVATHAGVLQTANQFGPAVFNLNVLKAIGFTQAPTGQTGVNGQPDNFSSVDIGRWSAGIPGVIMNSGTTGFVTYQDFANGPFFDYRVAGLQTSTQIGSQTFDVGLLPFISTGLLLPPTLSFGLAPNMTAVNTPFLPSTPPTPGIVQPFGGLVVPPAVTAPLPAPAPVAPVAPAPAPVAPAAPVVVAAAATEPEVAEPAARVATVAEAPAEAPAASASTTRATTEKPKPVIPGVNGAPLAKPSTSASSSTGASKPFDPFKGVNDMISNGIGALTGARSTAPSGSASAGGQDAGGSGTSSAGGAGSSSTGSSGGAGSSGD